MIKFLWTVILLVFLWDAQAQTALPLKADAHTVARKGKLFLYFGWNRSEYSDSDIHFKGDGYNFNLANVVAHDRPTHFDLRYFSPARLTVPQYQYRAGYYISDKYSISAGFNHMKYVMDAFQTVKINGTVNTPEAGNYNGTYQNQDIVLSKDFLQLEHTNGLNYLNVNFDRTETLWVGRHKHVNLSAVAGIGVGLMYPKSDVKLFGSGVDRWHVAGYGASSHLALRFVYFRNLFVQVQVDGGLINMPDIITTGQVGARAKRS